MWEPTAETVERLSQLLQQSNDGSASRRVEREAARQQLEAARTQPDLIRYLVYLLVASKAPEELRATSGLWLKSVLQRDWFNLQQDAVEYVKEQCPRGLYDPSPLVRNTSSIVVAALYGKLGLSRWPALLPELVRAIESSGPGDAVQEGAVVALKNVCEDSASSFTDDVVGQLVPKLIEFTRSSSAKVRSHAVSSLTEFVPLGSQPFLLHIDEFLESLFALAQADRSPETLSSICRAFTELLQVRPDKLAPHLTGVVQFASHCVRNRDEESLALEGAEFLLTLSESEVDEETLASLLPTVLEPLLLGMVFSDEDIFVLESVAEDDSSKADRAEDIRPVHARSRNHGFKEEEEDDEEEMEAALENWNLRKCCAGTLDELAQRVPSEVAAQALPLLLARIGSDNEWPVRESSVLAFGAIAAGVKQQGQPAFASELRPYLVELLLDSHAPIREIACWTLSRYFQEDEMDADALRAVLKCMLDVNKRVQAAACAALSTISEHAGSRLDPIAGDLFQHLRECFSRYQKKNLLALYECVQTVATAVTGAIKADPSIVEYVIEPMIARWESVEEDDFELLALSEAFGFLAVAVGPAFEPYAPPLFERGVLMVRDGLVALERSHLDDSNPQADPIAIACGFDLVDGLVQALGGEAMQPLFAAQQRSTQTSMVDLILLTLGTGEIGALEIKQSALSLLGDLAVYCFDQQLSAVADRVVPEVLPLVDAKEMAYNGFYESVGNNAMWALAEISMHHAKFDFSPYFNEYFQRLGSVLCSTEILPTSLMWNAAIALGRLGLGSANLLAPHLPMFVHQFLEVMVDVDGTNEKDTALQGICLTIAANPTALSEENLVEFFKVLATYFSPSLELKELVRQVYEGYKSIANVQGIIEKLPPAFKQQLLAAYPIEAGASH